MPYLIKSSAARMPGNCNGAYSYARIGLLEVEPGVEHVSQIAERARGVVRVVRTWERLNKGTTENCQSARAMREALVLKAELEGNEL